MGVIKAEFEALKDMIPAGNDLALDVGCGSSPYQNVLKAKGYTYVGIDISQKKRPSRKLFIFADAHNLPFKNETFSIVFSSHFLEHAENPEKVITEMTRVLKTKRFIITLVPFMTPFHSNDLWRFTPLGLRKIFNSCEILLIEVPTHVLTKVGHFVDVMLHHFGFKKIGTSIRNNFSVFDKHIGKYINFEGWAHSYIVVCKKTRKKLK
jgi:ubiquinone/menaquinone biosynthesis C-methylase UbiE